MAIDLDARRAERVKARADARPPVSTGEANGDTEPVLLNGTVIAELPAELPMAALLPLLAIKDDAVLLIREAIRVSTADDTKMDSAAAQLIVDLLVATPDLPQSLIDTVAGVTEALLGHLGYEALRTAVQLPADDPGRLSFLDVAELAKGVIGWYAEAFRSLGKSSKPASSAPSGGTTSNTTSKRSSKSTRGGSGPAQDTPGI